ncbi:putative reverse transcriptase domain-containing protein [Tanacetum coccineum]
MEVSVCSSAGVWPCPFRGFHCCPDGMAGSKGFPRLVAHIKRLHLSSDDRRGALREALSTDCELFVSVGEALKALDQWVCGVCMCLHALSRACHHTDGMTRFKWVAGDVEEFIVGIVRPQVRREVVPLGGVVVDEVLLDRVFSLPITTVKSIPHSCRMAFSHALAAALGKVAATPTSIEAWVKLLLLPRCTLRVFRPSNRQERRSGNRKSLQCHSIQRALASWGGDGFIELIPSLFAQPLRVVSGKDDRVSGSDSSTVGTNIKQCLRKVSDGHFTAAVKVLCSSGVAPFGTDTLTALLAKHPILPLLLCLDGLRAQHILDALCGEGSAIVVGLLKAISVVVNLLLEGRCPKFGVGVPSGAEAVLYGANRFLNKFHSDGSLAMLTGDFSNAFNLVDRTTLLHEVQTRCPSISLWVDFLYGQSARLYVGDDHIWSTIGVQQRDPLGPLLFALVLHPLVHRIRDCCQLLFHAWYLDDGMIIGDTKEVKEGLFPYDIRRPTLGVKLLGGAVSRDAGFISSLAVKRASRAVELMSLLPREAVSIFDNGLRRAIEAIVDHILQGCGIDGADSDYGYALDRARIEIVKSLGVSFDLSPRQKAVVKCLRAPRAQNFLTVIPIEGLGQHMSALEYQTILKHDLVRDVLYDVLKRARISSKKEAPVTTIRRIGFSYLERRIPVQLNKKGEGESSSTCSSARRNAERK